MMARDAGLKRTVLRGMGAALLACGLLGAGAAMAQDPNTVIEARKEALKRAAGSMKAIGAFVKEGSGTAADVQKAVAVLVEVSGGMPQWFPEGTAKGVGKSEALPAIWQNRADFDKKLAAFQAESKNFATIAAGGDKAAIGKQLGVVGGTCKACHDSYKGD